MKELFSLTSNMKTLLSRKGWGFNFKNFLIWQDCHCSMVQWEQWLLAVISVNKIIESKFLGEEIQILSLFKYHQFKLSLCNTKAFWHLWRNGSLLPVTVCNRPLLRTIQYLRRFIQDVAHHTTCCTFKRLESGKIDTTELRNSLMPVFFSNTFHWRNLYHKLG